LSPGRTIISLRVRLPILGLRILKILHLLDHVPAFCSRTVLCMPINFMLSKAKLLMIPR
jgi:hypothetical protein